MSYEAVQSVDSANRVRLPMIDTQTIDSMFVVRPSVIDECVNLVNSRRLGTMELASQTSEDVVAVSEELIEALGVEDKTSKALLSSGCLYGYLMADKSQDKYEFDSAPDPELIKACKGFVRASGPSELQLVAFQNMRFVEIDHFKSDLLSLALSSAQDHIHSIAEQPERLIESQLMFYAGVLAGAMARMPRPEQKEARVIRDAYSPFLRDSYMPALVQHEPGDRLTLENIASDLENKYRIRLNDGKLQVINSTLVQLAPNMINFYNTDNALSVDRKDVELVVTSKRDAETGEIVYTSIKDLDELDENPSIVAALIKRPDSKVKNKLGLVTSLHESHPYYEQLIQLVSNNTKRDYKIASYEIKNELKRSHKLDYRVIKIMAGVAIAENIIVPDIKMTAGVLAVIGALGLAQYQFNKIVDATG